MNEHHKQHSLLISAAQQARKDGRWWDDLIFSDSAERHFTAAIGEYQAKERRSRVALVVLLTLLGIGGGALLASASQNQSSEHSIDPNFVPTPVVALVGEPVGLAAKNALPVIYCPYGAKHTDKNPTESGQYMTLEEASSKFIIMLKDGSFYQCQKDQKTNLKDQLPKGHFVEVTPGSYLDFNP